MKKKVHLDSNKIFPLGILFLSALIFLLLLSVVKWTVPCKAQEKVARQADWPKKITIGFIPYIGPEKTEKKYQPLIEHLAKKLGIEVKACVPDNYIRLITALKNKKIEFAYLGPKSYVEAHNYTGAEVIAMELNQQGEPGYHAILISSKKSDIQSLDQAKGRILAFTDPDSTSGYLAPYVHFLRERDQTPAEFASRIVFAGSHAAVIWGVAKGKFHVGATDDMDLASLIPSFGLSPDSFNILWKSEMIPGAAFSARKDMPQAFKGAVLDALLSVNQNKPALDKMKIGGFISAKDSDYDMVRELKIQKVR